MYLFGSWATGRPHRESGLDLAILPRKSAVRERKLDILRGLIEGEMDPMIGFRNTLIHDYIEIDCRAVYIILQEGLGDLEALGRALAEFL